MRDLFWTEDRIVKAAQLWQEGRSARAIAELFGSKKNTVINMAHRNRDRFPARQDARQDTRQKPPEADAAPAAPIRHPDRVRRVTFSGAEVTMPRVPFIDGPAP
ncbi:MULTISPECIES: GcrA family cell cycle regulator [unclassified Rhizobium]|uniref:GcrA family cell cycle regulator n=1 Tax=unclassified Rhizobium TaxID=2613769 RepID=UPI001A998421|nr:MULTISPECIES: GcrA family cell cycle regulator [unclassified Rhizobium]MBX5160449.1 GcrA cell cycle regulator [Rhizobium sp. NZLR8]MBX5165288.1 GcrA cell cycle regulator [Rhizobium sp. NZLR4b]MBX5185044.1 GcrA cell cycle regulator [Rhizobium sp. NZLR5]MBX5191112.1 GcrA cell cycle regulator [Rhizobium sp. NZLR3b]MBX5204351.1 GcrA cell cycle regulator [Rhizobium sp. NZLR1]